MELDPILQRRLTPYQYAQFMVTLQIAQDGILDTLEEILSGKETSFGFEDIDDFEVLYDSEEE